METTWSCGDSGCRGAYETDTEKRSGSLWRKEEPGLIGGCSAGVPVCRRGVGRHGEKAGPTACPNEPQLVRTFPARKVDPQEFNMRPCQ